MKTAGIRIAKSRRRTADAAACAPSPGVPCDQPEIGWAESARDPGVAPAMEDLLGHVSGVDDATASDFVWSPVDFYGRSVSITRRDGERLVVERQIRGSAAGCMLHVNACCGQASIMDLRELTPHNRIIRNKQKYVDHSPSSPARSGGQARAPPARV
ncbi:hypothetical protein EVAR_98997_1 [Eumeta japonica]|uniref:Uncharacterized protein n=1 Tax=Eumeta variegata TaxID=151549 RepID=A0A4C1YRN4_EUMVA|nr:hypothetical protein EVAR_98997_1 [Eumeta japonica]